MKKVSEKDKQEFISQWLVSKSEYERRIKLIENELSKYISQEPFFEEYFDLKPIRSYIDYGYYFANFSKISDEMLKNYIEAGVRFVFLLDDDKEGIKIKELTEPILEVIQLYVKNDTFLELLIESEISGDERLKINDVESPISKRAIKLHIKKRMSNFIALTTEDIVEAQYQFINYKRKFYQNADIIQSKGLSEELNVELNEEENSGDEQFAISLGNSGFYELEKVKTLSSHQQNELIKLIVSKNTPYQIAMFNFLGFIKHIKETCKTEIEKEKKIAHLLRVSNLRLIKGNINVLRMNSKEDSRRYTSIHFSENVKSDYIQIKNQGV